MSSSARPLVSVVVPCFNQGRYLPAAIRSVRAQTHAPVELIVVDDGSTDDTGRVAADHGAIVMTQQNKGVAAARNAGLAAAHGEFVVMLDADDELLPDAVRLGADVLRRHPLASAVVGRCVPVDEQGTALPTRLPVVNPDHLYKQWLSMNFVWAPAAAMFRRQALQAAGGFPPDLGPSADYAVYLQLARTGTVVYDARDVALYRQHDAAMSRDLVKMLRTTLEVLRRERRLVPELSAEIRHGERAWRVWYGDLMIDELREHWDKGTLGGRHARIAAGLVRYCSGRVLREMLRKLTCAVRGRRASQVETGSVGGEPLN